MSRKRTNPKPYVNLCQDLMFQIFFSSDKTVLLSLLKSFLPLQKGQSVQDVRVLKPEEDGEGLAEGPAPKGFAGSKGLKGAHLQTAARPSPPRGRLEDIIQEADSRLRPQYPHLKTAALDLAVSLSGGETVNVEMQTVSHPKFIERMLYYWACSYTKYLQRGDEYDSLRAAYSLIFADFNLFPQAKEAVTSFAVRSDDPPYFPLTGDLCMVFADLTKNRPNLKKAVDNKDLWRYFLKESKRMGLQDLELLASKNEEMRMAAEHFKRISKEEHIRWREFQREKAMRDYISWAHWVKTSRSKGLEEGRAEGLQKGLQEGLQKGRQKRDQEIVCAMLRKKLDIPLISSVTGLSKEEILKLKAKK